MTDAETVNFDILLNGLPIPDTATEFDKMTPDKIKNDDLTSYPTDDKPAESMGTIDNVIRAPFLDSSKNPIYYVERYYSEPHYKSWFDRNYPGQTIEETGICEQS
jgi:hypothetical protein